MNNSPVNVSGDVVYWVKAQGDCWVETLWKTRSTAVRYDGLTSACFDSSHTTEYGYIYHRANAEDVLYYRTTVRLP